MNTNSAVELRFGGASFQGNRYPLGYFSGIGPNHMSTQHPVSVSVHHQFHQ